MPCKRASVLLAVMLLPTCLVMAADDAETDEQMLIEQSRSMVRDYGSTLLATLQQAIAQGGPVNAINVCKISAPNIGEQVSTKYTTVNTRAMIGRTAQRTRNPANNPDEWEQGILEYFDLMHSDGTDVNSLEYSERVTLKGKPAFRYMQSIPTGDLCLSCHGETLADDIRATLEQVYPNDNAIGFKPGELRGAFTIIIESH